MAHQLDMTTGEAACMFVGEPAWHRLGVIVKEAQDSEHARKLARLDWEVEQWPIKAANEAGTVVDAAGYVANVRSDTHAVLGVVGSHYRPYQNREAFDFMDAIMADRAAHWETAGALFGGQRIWLMARIPATIEVVTGDAVFPYLLLTSGHDGSHPLRIILTTVRTVCNNTLNLAFRGVSAAEGLTLRHCEQLEHRVAEARAKLGIITKRLDEFSQQASALVRKQMKPDELRDYFCQLVKDRSQKQQEKLLGAFLGNFENERQRIAGIRGTAWAAFNAVMEWADWQSTVRGRGTVHDERRLNSIWFGTANAIKQEAFNAALTLVA